MCPLPCSLENLNHFPEPTLQRLSRGVKYLIAHAYGVRVSNRDGIKTSGAVYSQQGKEGESMRWMVRKGT